MSKKTALVTGAAGFIGRNMTRHLIDRGYLVSRVDPAFTQEEERQFADVWRMDMRDYLDQHTEPYEWSLVVHAAAMEPNRKAIDTQLAHFPENVHLDSALFRWAHVARPGRVVYLSSSAAYPRSLQLNLGPHKRTRLDEDMFSGYDADSVYGITKVLGEQLAWQLKRDGIPVTVVRPFSGYGPDQTEDFPFGALVERIRRGENPIQVWGTGQQVRDWIHVDDVCRAIIALAEAEPATPTNICTGIGTSMEELIRLTHQIAGIPLGEIERLEGEPHGVFYRVGQPDKMLEYYTPRITLAAGIEERLAVTPV